MASFDAGSIEAHLTLDRTDFNTGLDQAKADADAATRNPVTFKVTADTTSAKTSLDDLATSKTKAGQDTSFTVKADTADATAGLGKVQAAKDDAGKDTSFTVKADTAAASADLAKVQVQKDRAGQDVSFTVKASDSASADLAKVLAEKDRLGRDVAFRVRANIDTAGIDRLGEKITKLKEGPFDLLKTAIVGLGPTVAPVAAGLVAAFAPLAPAIGSSVVGLEAFGQLAKYALTPAFTAATAVQKAQGAYNVALQSGTKQATAYATEQKAIATAYAGMSGQQIALAKQAGTLETAWNGVLKSIDPIISSALSPWLKDVMQLLGNVKPLIAPIANDFKAWGQELGQFLSGNTGKVRDFFALFGARSAGNIYAFGNALISFVKGAGALISDIGPDLSGASAGISDLAASFDKWAHSKEAADDIRGFFTWARGEIPEVKELLGSLSGAVGTLLKSFASSGGIDLRVIITGLQAISAIPPAAIAAIADGYVAISLGLRAATAAMTAWNVVSTISKGIQAALNDEIEVTGAALVISKIATLAMAAADVVVDAAETIYIGLMLAADAASLPLIVVIGAIVLAVAALGVGIYELVEHWDTAWHAILAAAQDVWNWIKQNWPLILGVLTGPIGLAVALIATHWADVQKGVQVAWNAIAGFFTNWWANITASFGRALAQVESIFKPAWDVVSDGVRSAWNAIASFFGAWWDTELNGWRKEISTFTGFFSAAWNTVAGGAKAGWNAIASFFTGWWNAEMAGWRKIISTFTAFFRAAWQGVESDAKSIWNAIASFFSSWWTAETALWRGTVTTLRNVLLAGWHTIESDAKSVFGAVLSFFKSFWSDLKTGFDTAVNGVKTAWDKIESVVRTPVQWVVKNVYDKLIVPFWNATGGAVGLPKLKALAAGGIVPGGYSPVDNQLAWVRSGEGVLQPGAVSALGGPGFINWANAKYGDVPVAGGSAGHYASGGTVPGTGKSSGSGGWLSDIGGAFTKAWDAGLHIGGDVLSLLSKITDVRQWLKLPLDGVEKIIDALLDHVPGSGGMETYAKDAGKKIVSAWIAKLTAATTGKNADGYGGHVNVSGTVIQWLTQALKDTGKPLSWLPGEEIIARYESGGNPNAINLTDSNAAAGDPSRGLMQCIMTTFDAYHQGGTSWNIYDPVANAAASINYQTAQYGGVWGVPGVISVEHGGGYVGYDSGGWLQPGGTFVSNTSGRPEPVLSADQWDMLGAVAGGGLGDKLDRIAQLLASQPRATAAGVGQVVNGSAHNAAFRSRYPR